MAENLPNGGAMPACLPDELADLLLAAGDRIAAIPDQRTHPIGIEVVALLTALGLVQEIAHACMQAVVRLSTTPPNEAMTAKPEEVLN